MKNDETMESAKKLLDSTVEGMDRFFIQNFAFMFSDNGVDFVLDTLNRVPSKEELQIFDYKRKEVEARNNSKTGKNTNHRISVK